MQLWFPCGEDLPKLIYQNRVDSLVPLSLGSCKAPRLFSWCHCHSSWRQMIVVCCVIQYSSFVGKCNFIFSQAKGKACSPFWKQRKREGRKQKGLQGPCKLVRLWMGMWLRNAKHVHFRSSIFNGLNLARVWSCCVSVQNIEHNTQFVKMQSCILHISSLLVQKNPYITFLIGERKKFLCRYQSLTPWSLVIYN